MYVALQFYFGLRSLGEEKYSHCLATVFLQYKSNTLPRKPIACTEPADSWQF